MVDAAVLEVFVQYRQALRFDDVIDVHVLLAMATRVTFQMAYLVTRDDEVAASVVTVHGAVVLERASDASAPVAG